MHECFGRFYAEASQRVLGEQSQFASRLRFEQLETGGIRLRRIRIASASSRRDVEQRANRREFNGEGSSRMRAHARDDTESLEAHQQLFDLTANDAHAAR